MLPDEIVNDFREKVDRTSTKTKIGSLIDQSTYFIKIMQHEEKLRKIFDKNKVLGIFCLNVKFWE